MEKELYLDFMMEQGLESYLIIVKQEIKYIQVVQNVDG